MRFKAAIISMAVVLMGAAGCDSTTTPVQRAAVSVSVTPAGNVLDVGQTATVTAVVANDTTGALSGVTWSSSTPALATVGARTGVVTAIAPGTLTVTATSNFNPTKSASATVTVLAVVVTPAVNVVPSSATLAIGQKVVLVATGDITGFTWSSSDTLVARVATTGEVTAVGSGTAIITAKSKIDPTKSGTSTVTVSFPATVALGVLGTGPVPERYTAEVAVRGTYAYTTTWSTRVSGTPGNLVKIWNVAGATPVLVDSLKNTNTGTTSDVQISPDGTLLVVSTEGLSGGSIVIYSLANPAAPAFISRYSTAQTTRGVHTVKLSVINGKLYGFLQIDPANAQLVIVDMSDPLNVQQVFVKVMGTPYVHDVFVRDGLLFAALWNDGMTIFDVGGGGRGGSPSNPVQISNIKTKSGYIHNVWWYQDPRNNSKKYVFLGEEGPTQGGIGAGGLTLGDIHVIDISDINAPKEVAKYSPGANMGTHNFWVDEPSGILYAAYYNGGVRAIDVRGDLGTCTPSQYVVHNTGNFNQTQSSNVPDDNLSITGAPLCDLKLMGREAGNALTTGGYFVWGVMMQGSRVYASDMGKGLVILDISALKR